MKLFLKTFATKFGRFARLLISTVVITTILGMLIAEITSRWFDFTQIDISWLLLFALFLSVLLIFTSREVWRFAKKALATATAFQEMDTDAPRMPVVIVGLSPMLGEKADQAVLDTHNWLDELAQQGDEQSIEWRKKTLELLCRDGEGPLQIRSWQQPLRVIKHNWEKLEVLGVILFEGAEKGRDDFEKIAKRVCPEKVEIIFTKDPAPPENFNRMANILDEFADHCCLIAGRKLRHLCIDMTASTKVYTAVALSKTLNTPAVASYVVTYDRKRVGSIIVFDADAEM